MQKKQINQKQETKNPFAVMEEEVLDFWEKNQIFKKSVEKPAPKGDYVFYDGPPFATGLPHYGHIVASIIKDVVPRFWTMNGYRVERKWGWDCHGLPIENIVEKELGSKSKRDIEEIGVAKFNQMCRSKVLEYVADWKVVIKKLGRWADMENDYKTMDKDFMESVWHVFKTMYEKGLVYEGYRSMHVCPRCETTLSQSEVTEGYKDIKDLSCVAKFKVRSEKLEGRSQKLELGSGEDVYLLAWTTTPWTLIGNVALAVGVDIDYIQLRINNEKLKINGSFILSKEVFEKWKSETEKSWIVWNNEGEEIADFNTFFKASFTHDSKMINVCKGRDLVGLEYEPLFDYYSSDNNLENRENGWKIYAGDFVTTNEGTGIVHIAPAFGDDDMQLGKKYNLPFVQHLTMDGYFKPEVKDFQGMNVKPIDDHMATDIEIIKYLAHNNLLFSKEKYEHSYPHCWRCDTPLLNYATGSWFVDVLRIKSRMIEVAQDINWSPKHIKNGRWGNWLEGARDWSISRQRFWASVIPIWECEHKTKGSCDHRVIIGSVAELEGLSGKTVSDLHKDVVDEITFPCSKCGGTMKRISDVFDCWFESGSMPFAQMHYPFENKEKFEKNFPAQFIAEGADQCRCWFYYMHILAVGTKDVQAFQNVIVNGIVLAEDGKKMSKKLKNYPDPLLIFDKYGADALRHYLLTSPVMLADNLNFSEKGVADSLRKTSMTLWNVVKFFDMFNDKSSDEFKNNSKNILDIWILIRLEQLIKEIKENMEAYNLPSATRPIAGFIDDFSTWYLRRSRDRFKGADEADKKQAVQTTRYVLAQVAKAIAPLMPFLAEQVWQKSGGFDFKDNSRSVHLEEWPHFEIGLEKGEAKKILDEMAASRKIVELALAKRDMAGIKVRQPLAKLIVRAPKTVAIKNAYIELIKDEVNVKEVEFIGNGDDVYVELDTAITPELKMEGIKREFVRQVNSIRKKQNLTINDRITIYWETDSKEVAYAVNSFVDEIKSDTLALDVKQAIPDSIEEKNEMNIEGYLVVIGVIKR